MPDLPVVEELLEKGARAVAASMCIRKGPHEIAEAVLDAVFPGWREGLTRVQRVAYPTDRVERRWVGPWVPVEEGTDG